MELLAPAKDASIGIEAFNHGADAVYIGAPRFSARAAAGNSIQDIERLASYGHQFGAKTIVAFNTIMSDSELVEAEKMAWNLYEAGADALIIQDLGLLKLSLPPIELHASTQTDNRTIEKVRLMHDLGMTRVVVARELTVEQIRAIHEAVPDVELECFVHGALCVCVSGQCYLSAALTGRSANRGECAQPCRLPMDLEDANGNIIVRQKHLLSLKDMNRSRYIEQLIDAGVTSLKIEGRLKDMSYVKNVTAYYRRLIDSILEGHPDWQHISKGKCYFSFEPKVEKSFNRGFTDYQNPREEYWNFDTPKAVGENVGVVTLTKPTCFKINGNETINNGDGFMINNEGFRVNKVENEWIYPAKPEVLKYVKPGMTVWRNLDYKFEQQLEKPTAKRKLPVDVVVQLKGEEFCVKYNDIELPPIVCAPAEKSQRDNYERQLSKLGDTIFEIRYFKVIAENGQPDLFVPSSQLTELRRQAVNQMLQKDREIDEQRRHSFVSPNYVELSEKLDGTGIIPTDFRANVMNSFSQEIMHNLNLEKVEQAFEIQQNPDKPVMVTRHCLKYALGHCPKHPNPNIPQGFASQDKWKEPMVLKIGTKKFFTKFGCKNDCMCEIFIKFAR